MGFSAGETDLHNATNRMVAAKTDERFLVWLPIECVMIVTMLKRLCTQHKSLENFFGMDASKCHD